MPIMTSAIKTLTAHQVARGSTLINIAQQIASSVGVADHVGRPDQRPDQRQADQRSGRLQVASEHVTDPAQMQKPEDFPQVAQILRSSAPTRRPVRRPLAGQGSGGDGQGLRPQLPLWRPSPSCSPSSPPGSSRASREESHLLDEDDALRRRCSSTDLTGPYSFGHC